jgi:hypothetical protein
VEDPEDDSRLFAININLGLKKLKEYYALLNKYIWLLLRSIPSVRYMYIGSRSG